MKHVQFGLALLGLAVAASAGDLAIQSFDGTGRLTFNEISTALVYRVEWAPTPAGPWTNFTGAAGAWLDAIPAAGAGSVTCSVPMCYRVVATVAQSLEGMALIPSGSFAMGATTNVNHDESSSDEKPSHTVYVSAFYLSRYEVTQARWNTVQSWAVTNGYSDLPVGSGKASDHPVHTVNWYAAVKWCNALSEREGRTPCYTDATGGVYRTGVAFGNCNWSAVGYRLPTEAEWERAARGGVANQRFGWGDSIQHSQANYFSDSGFSYDASATRGYHPLYAVGAEPYTSPVGAFAANGYGLHDMAGNVYEWCWDGYESGYYGTSPERNPKGPASGTPRSARGGSWYYGAFNSRTADRFSFTPGSANSILGLRVALSLGQQ